ncbi:hypothetical protein [Sunxiuqinia indica]|uniref:hypothetical protein n=1 Tax=Sunxiuqinia indica TaxID=2692584 RepID=UPI00135AE2B2|nr:hypothetical protein [Sunxiuqinia indica]
MNTKHFNYQKITIQLTCAIVFLFPQTGFSHSDYGYDAQYGNVSVSITTGFHYEEIRKAFILGMYAEKLSEEMNFDHKIVISYKHCYVEPDFQSNYYLSVGKGEYTWDTGSSVYDQQSRKSSPYIITGELSAEEGLVLSIFAYKISIPQVLNIIEYGIKNYEGIRHQQVEYNNQKQLYSTYTLKSINREKIITISYNPQSQTILDVLNERFYRPETYWDKKETFDSERIDYYCQFGQFFIYGHKIIRYSPPVEIEDTVLAVLDNIYWLDRPRYNNAVIFDSDSSFFYANWLPNKAPYISKKQIINKAPFKRYYPGKIESVGTDKIFISYTYSGNWEATDSCGVPHRYFGPKTQTSYFSSGLDTLIVDFDQFVNDALKQEKQTRPEH